VHYGVDVSSNNIHPINWAAIATWAKQTGGGEEPFMFVKVSQGTGYVNSQVAGDVASARAQGIVCAGYLFDEGLANVGAEEAVFKAHAMGMPQADDMEMPEGLTPAEYAQHSKDLIAVDTSALIYLNQAEVQEGFPANNLWLADYNNAPGSARYPCLVHQYSETGVIPGVAGQYDLDCWLGTEAQFTSYFKTGSLPPPPHPGYPPWPGRVIKQPPVMTGNDVQTWQAQMAKRGWKITVDGAYGPASESTCKSFQSQKKLKVDGMVGQQTWDATFQAPVTYP
jgi:Putative peptidoglycan binding domain/Glycosyl hydrolases family 25